MAHVLKGQCASYQYTCAAEKKRLRFDGVQVLLGALVASHKPRYAASIVFQLFDNALLFTLLSIVPLANILLF